MRIIQVFILFVLIGLIGCQSDSKTSSSGFERIPSSESGVSFANILDEYKIKSPFNYVNVYLGGGVAIGDINNDGLNDIYLTSNMGSSKLYLNKGNFKFEDITEKSGAGTSGWATAVTMADINNDGWLDIYVCRSYHDDPNRRRNLLLANNRDGTFTNLAPRLGLDDENYSIGASFFDYDKDGDLDLIVGNHPRYRSQTLETHYEYWQNPVKEFSNRLFRNDRSVFVDVTEEAGLLAYGFSLGISTSDFTNDGYPDIFITVDHDEPDLIYKNNRDGTFTNIIGDAINQSSLSSMGVDAGDLNHDKYSDLFVAEMLSEDHYRQKINMSMQSVDRFSYLTDTLGYKYYQMHNFLYLNNGNETFSDVSLLSGTAKSDWTWASFFMDYNNDGWQDIYCTNGLYREIFMRDNRAELDSIMLSFNGDMARMNAYAEEYSRNAPQQRIENYLFQNKGNLEFDNVAMKTGLSDKTISTGAAYGDLDNDGDLDLVVNNLGDESIIYRNNSEGNGNYIVFKFNNVRLTSSIGSKIYIHYGDDFQMRELLTTRGFQSSCENRVHFGLGDIATIDKVEIIWPNDKYQVIENVKANQVINIDYNNASGNYNYNTQTAQLVEEIASEDLGITYVQQENQFNDYDIQVLLPHKMSEYGPFLSVADINGDGLEDFFAGSPHGQASEIYIQSNDGKFSKSNQPALERHKLHEDGQSVFVDIDNDGDQDLIVGSTGYEFENSDPLYQSRVYFNNGKGKFSYNKNAFPDYKYSTSCIKPIDIDNDGDQDFFIGGRLDPHKYPLPGTSAIMINDGTGNFQDNIDQIAPGLKNHGMVKDAIWEDINHDGVMDLITVGEWMPIGFWINEDGTLVDKTSEILEKQQTGWWNTVKSHDLDGNGLNDIIVGNLGLNYSYQASDEKPFMVYANDFDKSGSSDIVLGTYYGDVIYPVRGKSCSSEQIPDLKNEFETFEKFAVADIFDVYGEGLDEAKKYEVNQFANLILYQEEVGKFSIEYMPRKAQQSPINDMVIRDFNEDGLPDILAAGNMFQSEIETGRADSGTGVLMINKGDRKFETSEVYDSGLYLPDDVKSLAPIKVADQELLLVGINREALKVLNL